MPLGRAQLHHLHVSHSLVPGLAHGLPSKREVVEKEAVRRVEDGLQTAVILGTSPRWSHMGLEASRLRSLNASGRVFEGFQFRSSGIRALSLGRPSRLRKPSSICSLVSWRHFSVATAPQKPGFPWRLSETRSLARSLWKERLAALRTGCAGPGRQSSFAPRTNSEKTTSPNFQLQDLSTATQRPLSWKTSETPAKIDCAAKWKSSQRFATSFFRKL